MASTIPEIPLDNARLAELVLDQGDALARLTDEVAALRRCLAAMGAAAGLPGPDPSPLRGRAHLRLAASR